MAKFQRFEEMEVWQQARLLTKAIYGHTRSGAWARDFALRDQIRRAAVSLMSNIAEGYERDSNAEFVQFLSIAKGSCGELRSQLYIARDAEYIGADHFSALVRDALAISRSLGRLIQYLRKSDFRSVKFVGSRRVQKDSRMED